MEFKVIEEYPRFYVGICKHGYRECFMKGEYTPIDGMIRKRKTLYDPNKEIDEETKEDLKLRRKNKEAK